MTRSQFAFLLVWTALFALGGAALFRNDPGDTAGRRALQSLEESQSAGLREIRQALIEALARAPAGGAASGDAPAIFRAPAPEAIGRDAEFLVRLEAVEQSLKELSDLLQRNDVSKEDFAEHPLRPEAFTEAALLNEEDLAPRFYGLDYRQVLTTFGAPAEARLTGDQQHIQWVYSVPPNTYQFIFHDGQVVRTNRWQE